LDRWLRDKYHSVLTAGILLSLLCLAAHADGTNSDQSDRFKPFGDFRVRLEQDWDSLNGDGTKRDDRLRLRVRVRAGFEARISDDWSAVVAARSGPDLSQQSPHITIVDFDNGPTGPYEFNLDHWYLNYDRGGLEAWIGRNEMSFWHQDDLFIFDNVTYPGLGGSYKHGLGRGQLTWNLNYVALPVGMKKSSGTGLLGQLVYEQDFEGWGVTVAGGYFGTDADPDNPDGQTLLTQNNTRDYRVVNLMAQFRSQMFEQPYYIGLDYNRNLENYGDSPPDSFSQFHKDDRDAYVLEFVLGEKGEKGDWQVGYYYSYLEALSVHSSYIADDWVRWGNANQVRATNLKGSELRAIYSFSPTMNIFARLFFVDAISLLEAGDTTLETGNRLRIDFNISF
jgi:hypothetical protein